MFIAIYLFTLLGILNAQVAPNIPASPLPPKELAEPYKEQNLCAFLKPSGGSVPYSFWTCGAPFKQQYCGADMNFEYKCCPGFKKSDLLNNQCGETMSVWKLLPNHLSDYAVPKFANLLKSHANLPDMFNENGTDTYTVFAPYDDSAMKHNNFDLSSIIKGEPHPLKMHISKNRIYSVNLKNGVTVTTMFDNHKLKVTTYSNGLVFIDCRALVNPDHETKNGVIHYISGSITPHVGFDFQRKTVLQAMQNDPLTNSFYNDIPADMRVMLDQETDNRWITVFAPKNDVWNEEKVKYEGKIPTLVKNHILNRMICAQAITKKATSLGPTVANEYLGVDCNSGGSRIILDACGNQGTIIKEDLVSGNGVVHIIDKVLKPTSVMTANDAISCISQGNPNLQISNFLKQSSSCDLKINSDSNYVLLIPTDEAFDWLKNSPTYGSKYNQMLTDESYKCQVLQYHVLKRKDKSPLSLVNQMSFETNHENNGKPLSVVSYLVKYRDGSKLFFNSAKTQPEPRKFKQGHMFFVDKVNIPPTKTMTSIISERPDASVLSGKLKETGYDSTLSSYGDNVLFLAWQNHGWETRDEKKWGSSELQKLFQLHTIKMELWGSDIGYFHPETITTVNSVYKENGLPFQLQIKRELNGNTFIGYEGLSFDLWSMVIESNLHATDGMVWKIDWPLRFKK